jgi:Toprim domain
VNSIHRRPVAVNTALTWPDIERITQGQLGRTISTPCPFCSHTRRTRNQRKPVFAVKLKEIDFAVYNCVHCGESGYVHPDRSAQVVDLAERKRLHEARLVRERNDKQERTARALKLWDARQPFIGSPADTYLRAPDPGRGIGDWLDAFDLDESLGFHPALTLEGQPLRCMLALVRDIVTDEPVAIHRTFLTADKIPQRIERRSLGPIAGGAIKLSLDGDVTHGVLIGEGIESTFSASRVLAMRPCWSVLSRSGIANFPVMAGMECITVAVDNDDSGDGQRDAETLSERMTAAGIEVRRTYSSVGKDFNDVLRGSK